MRNEDGRAEDPGPGAGLSEIALVRRAQAGDEVALTSLFDGQAGTLRRRIRGRLSPAVRRKVSESDVMQEACLVASRRLEAFEYRGEGSFGAWLGRIADHAALKAVRRYTGTAKRNAYAETTRDQRAETGQYGGDAPSPSRRVMATELRERMDLALADLPEDYRAVLELLLHRRLTLAQAAELMGRSVNAVKKLHARALGELAEKLGVRGRRRDGPL